MNELPDPHDAAMHPIVAASSETIRRQLVELTQGAHFTVHSVARDPAALALLLRSEGGAWVVTGGSVSLARPFLRASRLAHAAAVAVVSGAADVADRADLDYGSLAVLRTAPALEKFRAASRASQAGLNVWDPALHAPLEAAQAGAAPLSPREREVLELTGTGLSTKAVARQLGISPNTVKFHLQAAFAKLGVRSRAEAVMSAIRRGELAV